MKSIGAPKCMRKRGTCEVHRAAVMPTGERVENLSYIFVKLKWALSAPSNL